MVRRWPVAWACGLIAALVLVTPPSETPGGTPAAAVADTAEAGTRTLAWPQAAVDGRPNIVLITTDDMAWTDLRWMPNTRRLLQAAGVTIEGFLSNHPLCCPARAEILTGQYAHNNGVHTNYGPFGGYLSMVQPRNHVGAWLKAAGYKTALVGKHLHGWDATMPRPGGWSVFDPILNDFYAPFNVTMYNNGSPQRFGRIHTSDLVGQRGSGYIRRFSRSGSPFFVWISQVAPHNVQVGDGWGLPVPADRHRSVYPTALPPSLSSPAFNEDDLSDKPAWLQARDKVSRRSTILLHRARVRTLRSVDDQVAHTLGVLRATGEARSTYVFFTSDNGFLMGEHRLRSKNVPYEPSLRVPLLVRGPGLPAGTTRRQTYGMVDLAPTFVQLSSAVPQRVLDGRSMLPTLRRGEPGYTHYLIQTARTGEEWWWRGVRSTRYVYVRYDDGFEELYDLVSDPAQLQNVARNPAYGSVRAAYAARLSTLASCAGDTCRSGGDPLPAAAQR